MQDSSRSAVTPGVQMGRKKPRLNDEHKRYTDRVSLFQHYTTGGPQPEPQAPPPEADPDAAERLSPDDAVWPPELARLRKALTRARDEDA
jgi:hypothetical protein